MSPRPLPPLRPIEPRRFPREGEPALALRDPLQLAEGEAMLVVPETAAPVLALWDGTRDRDTLVHDLDSRFGLRVAPSAIDALHDALDDHLLLDNARAEAARQRVLDDWRALPERPPSHAGAVYPANPPALRAALDRWIRAAVHHGDLDQSTAAAALEPEPAQGRLEVDQEVVFPFGLLSPHIDYARGGATYGAVWARAAAAARAAERVVILATDHGGPPGTITLTRQSYATPLGRLPTDREAVDALAAAIGPEAAFAGELRHRGEHSIELVALWLQHVRRGAPLPTIPILVGGFDHTGDEPIAPAFDPLLAALQDLAREGKVLFIASGDLAHVGPAFGGDPVDAPGRACLAGIDGELTTHISSADPEAFLSAIHRVRNAHNVCGVSPIWLAMRAVSPTRATITAYRQCPADDTHTSWVTITGATFD